MNMTGESMDQAKFEKERYGDGLATTVSLMYDNNSDLLTEFYSAVEMKIVK